MNMIVFCLNVVMKLYEERYIRALSILRQLLPLRQRRPKTDRDNSDFDVRAHT